MAPGSKTPAKKSPNKPPTKKAADGSKNKTEAENLGPQAIPGPSKSQKQKDGSTASRKSADDAEPQPTTVKPLPIPGAEPRVPTSTTYTADNLMPSSDESPSAGSDPSKSGSYQQFFSLDEDSAAPKSKDNSVAITSESVPDPATASTFYKDPSFHPARQQLIKPEPTGPRSDLNKSSLDEATESTSKDRFLKYSPGLRASETLPDRPFKKNMTNPEAAADYDRRRSVAVLVVERSGGSGYVNYNQDNSIGSGLRSFPHPNARQKPLMHTDKRAAELDGYESESDKVPSDLLVAASGDETLEGVLSNIRSRSSSPRTSDRVAEESQAEETDSVPSDPQSRTTSAPTRHGVAEEFLRQVEITNQAQLSHSLISTAELERRLEITWARFTAWLSRFLIARGTHTATDEEDGDDSERSQRSEDHRSESSEGSEDEGAGIDMVWFVLFSILGTITVVVVMVLVVTGVAFTTPVKHLNFHGDI